MKQKPCFQVAQPGHPGLCRKAAASPRWMLPGLVEMCKTMRYSCLKSINRVGTSRLAEAYFSRPFLGKLPSEICQLLKFWAIDDVKTPFFSRTSTANPSDRDDMPFRHFISLFQPLSTSFPEDNPVDRGRSTVIRVPLPGVLSARMLPP